MAGRGDGEGDGDVPHGRLLVRFADAVVAAVTTGSSEALDAVRRQLEETLGARALVDAAAIAAIFSCNVRVADASGVPLDQNTAETRERIGARVGIARYEEPAAARGEPS